MRSTVVTVTELEDPALPPPKITTPLVSIPCTYIPTSIPVASVRSNWGEFGQLYVPPPWALIAILISSTKTGFTLSFFTSYSKIMFLLTTLV